MQARYWMVAARRVSLILQDMGKRTWEGLVWLGVAVALLLLVWARKVLEEQPPRVLVVYEDGDWWAVEERKAA